MADIDALAALLGQLSADTDSATSDGGSGPSEENGGESIFGDIDIDTVLKLIDIFSKLDDRDKNTDLLLALKPHLRDENRGKIDRAVKLMKLMSVFMLLRDSGLLNGLM